jgi:radical SAM protein with 4Fe4S-binding SPASM domain
MSLEMYNLLLYQLSDFDYKGQLAPCFYNEPLLDKRLPEMMRTARTVLPKAQLTIYTNGSLLTTRNILTLFNSGLDGMVISQYEENLPKDDVRHVLSDLPQNIKKKIRYRILKNDQYLSNRGGMVKIKKSIKKKRCYQASTDAIIDYEGNVLLCCNDYKIEHVFGNIEDKHILEIWNQPDYKKVRRELRKGIFKFDICKACTG